MGANTTQGVAIVFFLIAFILLAGALAGGGVLMAVGFLAVLAVAIFFFVKCKPWEHQND
jgi:hypothetical protein